MTIYLLSSPLGGAFQSLQIFKMEATNRKRKRDFQDVDETDELDQSFGVENCGLTAVLSSRKRRKSLGTSELKALRKVIFKFDWQLSLTGARFRYQFSRRYIYSYRSIFI